jgi:hypothetical protein
MSVSCGKEGRRLRVKGYLYDSVCNAEECMPFDITTTRQFLDLCSKKRWIAEKDTIIISDY